MQVRAKGSNQTQDVLKSLPPTDHITEIQRHWLAGFVDSEGSFSITRQPSNLVPCVSIYNNNPFILRRIQKWLGFGFLERVARSDKPNANISYQLEFYRYDEACAISNLLRPYLRLKSEQASVVAQACAAKPADREVLKAQITKLNEGTTANTRAEYLPRKVDLTNLAPELWAYFSGYLDGDGCLSYQPQNCKRYWYPYVMFYSCKAASLNFLYDTFGGNMVLRPSRKANWFPSLELKFQDQKYVKQILAGIKPYSYGKADEVDIMLKSCESPAALRHPFVAELEALRIKNETLFNNFEEVELC